MPVVGVLWRSNLQVIGMEDFMDQKKEKRSKTVDSKAAKKAHSSGNPVQDANVDAAGHCILTQDGEMARPNSGEPCDEGHRGS